MITRETDYAIRALLYLACSKPNTWTSASVLANQMEIPYRFLRRILLKLGEMKLVMSARGKYGGVRLAKPADALTLFEIVQAADPQAIMLNICLVEGESCTRSSRCVIHDELADIQQALHTRLHSITLAQLADKEQARQAPAIS
jgi:Rrf2 family protein